MDPNINPHEVELREQDRWLPIANVARLMKNTLPPTAKVSKDAKECMQECVSEFISFITSEASDKCLREKRKTINGEDILYSMHDLGFENYAEVLKIYLAKYREQQALRQERGETRTTKKASKSSAAAAAATATAAAATAAEAEPTEESSVPAAPADLTEGSGLESGIIEGSPVQSHNSGFSVDSPHSNDQVDVSAAAAAAAVGMTDNEEEQYLGDHQEVRYDHDATEGLTNEIKSHGHKSIIEEDQRNIHENEPVSPKFYEFGGEKNDGVKVENYPYEEFINSSGVENQLQQHNNNNNPQLSNGIDDLNPLNDQEDIETLTVGITRSNEYF